MKKVILIFILIWPAILSAQPGLEINLSHCLASTAKNYPLSDHKILLDAVSDLEQQIIQSGFLPQIVLNGQISYQSDVTYLPINLPNVSIPQTSKDWYKLSLNVSQLIYDGGALEMQKKLNKSNSEIEKQSVEIELYKVQEIVQSTFFNIILLQENKKIILLLQNELNEKLKSIESGIRNGVILPSNKDNLMAELIKIEQNIFEFEIGVESSIENLNILTGLQFSKNDSFVLPQASSSNNIENKRPEFNLFDSQISKINLMRDASVLKRKPKILGFGQAGYGRPALNMLSNDFEPYFVVGAKFSWKVFDWGNVKKERKSFDIRSQIVKKNREVFNTQLKVLLTKKKNEIKRLESYILKDIQIVKLKAKVAKASSSQFENGQITATEFLLEKNTETKAKLNLQLHKVQLRHAQINYEYTMGNLNF